MRTRLMHAFPETALERILDALEHELAGASDADVLEAADDLGMKPQMKGSAAFLGLRYPSAPHRAEDFFDAQWMLQVLNDPRRIWLASAALPQKPPLPAASRTAARARPARRKSPRPKEPREG
ncbi:MAG: hypothetical protein KGJ68_11395 [Gammaproteobacteria bacterium]|nr:hypothetical protein [Gammaproteobacteria bacterium]